MIAPADTARTEWDCPFSRLWGQEKVDRHCRGDTCPMWRWVPLSADAPEFKAAVAQKLKDLGGGPVNHKPAVAWVMENREALGLPAKPTHGYCGAGGKPE